MPRTRATLKAIPQYISLADLQGRLQLSRTTIRRQLKDAGVHAFVSMGGKNASVRYVLADVEAFLAKNTER
jgi:hypothetical protein